MPTAALLFPVWHTPRACEAIICMNATRGVGGFVAETQRFLTRMVNQNQCFRQGLLTELRFIKNTASVKVQHSAEPEPVHQLNTRAKAIVAVTKEFRPSRMERCHAEILIMIAVAAVFGPDGSSGCLVAQNWLNRQAEARLKSLEAQAQRKPVATQTLVVASRPLRFGNELTQTALREIPCGGRRAACRQLRHRPGNSQRRVAASSWLQSSRTEPVLASKITGSGQRATLSALLQAPT